MGNQIKSFNDLSDEEKEHCERGLAEEWMKYGVSGKPKEYQIAFEKAFKEGYLFAINHIRNK